MDMGLYNLFTQDQILNYSSGFLLNYSTVQRYKYLALNGCLLRRERAGWVVSPQKIYLL